MELSPPLKEKPEMGIFSLLLPLADPGILLQDFILRLSQSFWTCEVEALHVIT